MNAPVSKEPLFTAPFLTMWAFSFSVFVSLFMLLPVVPFQVLAEGGTVAEAGLFMGLLTYSSGLSRARSPGPSPTTSADAVNSSSAPLRSRSASSSTASCRTCRASSS